MILSIFAWALLTPLTYIIPRRSDMIVVLGRDGGKYLDNCKFFFIAACRRTDLKLTPVFLVRELALKRAISEYGRLSELMFSVSGFWTLLRAGTVVFDSVDWRVRGRLASSRGARIVQLWHGIPLKIIERSRLQERVRKKSIVWCFFYNCYLAAIGRYINTDWFLSTSEYVTEKAFSLSFDYSQVSHAGYPRNDIFFSGSDKLSELGVDSRALRAISEHRSINEQRQIGIYAPTFREALNDPFADGTVDLSKLSATMVKLDTLLLIKLHPWMHDRLNVVSLPGIFFVAPDSDVYPLLKETNFLITDYSSIFFDYLLLDRPVLFFSYDLEEYLSKDRAMYFDYSKMTPGPKARTIEQLIDEIERVSVQAEDAWILERSRVRDLVFKYHDGCAADRLLDELFPK